MLSDPSFSVVVTARDEARTLPMLFASLGEFMAAGGELLVVDTGSDDDTVRIAREAGARVERAAEQFHSVLTDAEAAEISRRFSRGGDGPLVQPGQRLFDFGRAREFASQRASHDFVWHIDASDVIVTADFDFLETEIRSGRVSSFDYFLRLGTSRFRALRFFDRRLHAWCGRVHEAPIGTGVPMTGRRVSCREDQLSLRHIKNEKTRNYLAGLALDVIDDPSAPRWKHYLGRELWYGHYYRSAIAILREHVRMPAAAAIERGESLCLIGASLDALGRADAAAQSYFRASRVDPSRRQPFLKLASLCQARGDFQGSAAFAAAALTVVGVSAYIDADESHASDPHALLYWSLFWLGRREEARAHWDICRQLVPENEKFREDGRLFAGTSSRAVRNGAKTKVRTESESTIHR
jgi:glycosyltransferase involved in cell wall biosynthesis